jgi:type IV secretory pathway VirB2 component (pilin)
VIGSGLLDLVVSLSGAVATIAVVLGVIATGSALWQLRAARST